MGQVGGAASVSVSVALRISATSYLLPMYGSSRSSVAARGVSKAKRRTYRCRVSVCKGDGSLLVLRVADRRSSSEGVAAALPLSSSQLAPFTIRLGSQHRGNGSSAELVVSQDYEPRPGDPRVRPCPRPALTEGELAQLRGELMPPVSPPASSCSVTSSNSTRRR